LSINLNILFPTIIFIFLCFILPKIFNNLCLLKNNLNKTHNINIQEASLTGGICLIITLLSFHLVSKNFFYIEFATLILFIGLLSDADIIKSPKKRLFLIVIIIGLFSLIENFIIINTNVKYIDQLIKYSNLSSILFFIFCISILINGCNFIDGINNNLNFYFLCSNIIISLLKLDLGLNFDINILLIFISLIFILFNFFDKIFFGDSGAYLIGFIIGVDLVNLFNANNEISKFFAVLIVFYPCFEVLFSMIRKYFFKYSPLSADSDHLHSILVTFLIKKKEKKLAHLMASFFLNLIFIIPVMYNFNKFDNTKSILISIIIVMCVYLILFSVVKKLNKLFKEIN
jgi:UDP-N-acetylmuramyl pentapeptide phosphotransferase/UDP-N-acetylglucosamine-1-phosphate transferase